MKVSCASCHHPDEGFGRHTQFGVGISDQTGGRNSPISYNRILSDPQFWDGRAGSLEEQAVGPIANPIEMGNTHEACVECLKGRSRLQAAVRQDLRQAGHRRAWARRWPRSSGRSSPARRRSTTTSSCDRSKISTPTISRTTRSLAAKYEQA